MKRGQRARFYARKRGWVSVSKMLLLRDFTLDADLGSVLTQWRHDVNGRRGFQEEVRMN